MINEKANDKRTFTSESNVIVDCIIPRLTRDSEIVTALPDLHTIAVGWICDDGSFSCYTKFEDLKHDPGNTNKKIIT